MTDKTETAKYQARIPKRDYAMAKQKADRIGISVNTAIIQALRSWLDLPDDSTPVPQHQKLSEVIIGHLGEMENRIMDLLDPQGLRHVTSMSVDPKVLEAFKDTPGFHTGGFVTSLKLEPNEVPAVISSGRDLPVKMVPTRYGQSCHLVQHLTIPGDREWGDAVELAGARLGTAQPLKGQQWVITGELATMTRDQACSHLMVLGAMISIDVRKKTTAVLIGTGAFAEKVDAAEALCIPQWSERQFLHLLKGCGLDVEIPK